MRVELLSPSEWLNDPRSREIPHNIGYLAEFSSASCSDPFSIARIRQLSVPQAQLIAKLHGWKIRKGNAHDDLLDRKGMLDLLNDILSDSDADDFRAQMGLRDRDDLLKLLEKAGVGGGKYLHKAQRIEALLQWRNHTLARLKESIAEAAWVVAGAEAIRAGRPVNLETANRYQLRNPAVKTFGYEECGDRLVKGGGKRWRVESKTMTEVEYQQALEDAGKSLQNFDDQSDRLKTELENLRLSNAGATKPLDSRVLAETLELPPRIAAVQKMLLAMTDDHSGRAATEAELAELTARLEAARAAADGMVDSLSNEEVERLIFLERITGTRPNLRGNIAAWHQSLLEARAVILEPEGEKAPPLALSFA